MWAHQGTWGFILKDIKVQDKSLQLHNWQECKGTEHSWVVTPLNNSLCLHIPLCWWWSGCRRWLSLAGVWEWQFFAFSNSNFQSVCDGAECWVFFTVFRIGPNESSAQGCSAMFLPHHTTLEILNPHKFLWSWNDLIFPTSIESVRFPSSSSQATFYKTLFKPARSWIRSFVFIHTSTNQPPKHTKLRGL